MTDLLLPGQSLDNALASLLDMDAPYFANLATDPGALLDETCWGHIERSLPDLRLAEGAPYVTSNGPVGWQFGQDDAVLYGDPDANGGQIRRAWRWAWRANLAAAWAGGRFGPNHSSVAYSGTWASEAPAYAPYGLRVSTVSGASATVDIPADYHGGFINFLLIGEPEGVAACAAATVTVTGATPGFEQVSLLNVMPFGHSRVNLRFALPVTGDVQQATIANFGGGRLAFAGWSIEAFKRPLVWATLIPTPPVWAPYSPSITAAYNAAAREAFAEFSPYGPAVTVDLDPVVAGPAHPELWTADGLHLNAAGIPLAAQETVKAMATVTSDLAHKVGPRERDELYARPHGALPATATRGWLPVPKSDAPPTGISAHGSDFVPLTYFDGSLWIDPEGDGNWVEFQAGGPAGAAGGWLFGEVLKGQRPAASADLLGLNFLAWDIHGGTHQVCNGTSWVDVAPGLSRPTLMHGDEAHLDPVVAPEVTDAKWLQGNFDDRPPASVELLGSGFLALDEEGGTPYACNGMSWVHVALPYGATVGDTTGETAGEVTDAKWLAGNYDDRPPASSELLGCGWHSLDRPEDPALECTGMSWVEAAAGASHVHSVSLLRSSDLDGYIHVADFGAEGDQITDDTAALNAAWTEHNTNGLPLLLRGKNPENGNHHRFVVTDTLNWNPATGSTRVKGLGINRSRIIMAADNRPIIKLDGEHNDLEDFALYYLTPQRPVSGPDLNTASSCIEMFQVNRSRFSKLLLQGCSRGLSTSSNPSTYMFSCSFSDIVVRDWRSYGIYLQGINAGLTGSQFNNIYITNNWPPAQAPGSVLTGGTAVRIAKCIEMEFNQLNIEWSRVSVGLDIDTCRHVIVNGMHFEGIAANAESEAFIRINGGVPPLDSRGCFVQISGLDFLTSKIDGANLNPSNPNYSLFKLAGTNDCLEVHDVTETDDVQSFLGTTAVVRGTPTPAFRRLVGGSGFTKGSVRFTGNQLYKNINHRDYSGFGSPTGPYPTPSGEYGPAAEGNGGRDKPMVRQEGNRFPHFVVGSSTGINPSLDTTTALLPDSRHGWLYLPKVAGMPTATPADHGPGVVAAGFNSVDDTLVVRTGAGWVSAGGGGFGPRFIDVAKEATAGDGWATPWTGWEAAVQAAGRVAVIFFRPGGYYQDVPIRTQQGWRVEGCGRDVTFIFYRGTGSAWRSFWPINYSGRAELYFGGFTLSGNPSAGTNKAGFEDVCGALLRIEEITFSGFRWGIIFDGTEIAHIDRCDFTTTSAVIAGTYGGLPAGTGGGIWFVDQNDNVDAAEGNHIRVTGSGTVDVNGVSYPGSSAAHSQTVLPSFGTNQLTIKRSQFNTSGESPGDGPSGIEMGIANAYGIVIDGTAAHAIYDCNFNKCDHHIRVCGEKSLLISGGEHELSRRNPIAIYNTRLNGSPAARVNVDIEIANAYLLTRKAGVPPIKLFGACKSLTTRACSFPDNHAGSLAAWIQGLGLAEQYHDIGSHGTSGWKTDNLASDTHDEGATGTSVAPRINWVLSVTGIGGTDTVIGTFDTVTLRGVQPIRVVLDLPLSNTGVVGDPVQWGVKFKRNGTTIRSWLIQHKVATWHAVHLEFASTIDPTWLGQASTFTVTLNNAGTPGTASVRGGAEVGAQALLLYS